MSPEEVHLGPFEEYDDLVTAAGPKHPFNAKTFATLHWYDGPIVSVVTVPGDPRPRLDVMIDDHHEGEDATRVFTSVHHQLIFDRMETLQATLHTGVPSRESYRLAEHIERYRTRMTRIDHPNPSHEMWTSRHTAETLPPDELADPWEAEGLLVPGLEPIKKDEKR